MKHLFVSILVKQNLFVSVFVHKCLMMLNDVKYETFKMFVKQMSNYLFVISFQLMFYKTLRYRLDRPLVMFFCLNWNLFHVIGACKGTFLNDVTLDWYLPTNSSLHTRQSWDDESVRFQSGSFVLRTTWKHVISSCKVYSIPTIETLTWEGIEFDNCILMALIHLCQIISSVQASFIL